MKALTASIRRGDKPYRDLFASMNAIQQEVILARDYDYTKGVKHEANYNTMAQTYGRPGMNKKNRKQLPHDRRNPLHRPTRL